jgi:hypothetical protein
MHVSIRLHLVHAVVARLGEAVAVLISVRRALVRMRMRRLTVAIQRRDTLLWRGCLETCSVATYGCSVRRVGASASVTN